MFSASLALAMTMAMVSAASDGTVRINGKDYVPAVGCQMSVDDRAGVYNLVLGGRHCTLAPGFDVALVDGRAVNMDGTVLFRDGEMLVPAGIFALSGVTHCVPDDGSIPLRKVILDPGHGGQDSGALGPTRIREKDVTLSVALRLKTLLEAKGVEVVITRTGDTYIPLLDRSSQANKSGADLFLSIHCNGAPTGEASGAETFALTWSITDVTRAQKAAARLAPDDVVDGASCHVSRGAEQAIFSAYLSEQRRQSLDLARAIQGEMVRQLGEEDRGVKVKNLSVLRETYVPAALAEIGFITHRDTEAKMRSAAWR
ncbi:MAG TPA: N-acetylmuramoyl-L-alanine amidase, partial [Planctomycetota bacterium]|nr:N-acetylmuramoyl-L-alanine amidase [Planctomycetota bacterium]